MLMMDPRWLPWPVEMLQSSRNWQHCCTAQRWGSRSSQGSRSGRRPGGAGGRPVRKGSPPGQGSRAVLNSERSGFAPFQLLTKDDEAPGHKSIKIIGDAFNGVGSGQQVQTCSPTGREKDPGGFIGRGSDNNI